MAIAHVATEYVFSDFLLKDPTEAKYKGVRLELAVDKIVTFLAVGLPLFLISLAFAQEVSVGEHACLCEAVVMERSSVCARNAAFRGSIRERGRGV